MLTSIILFAAGVCNAYSTVSSTLSPYPEYTGSQKIHGWVTVDVNPDNNLLRMTYSLTNLETSTSGGFHVHLGKSCSDKDLVGGHYYDTSTIDPDPWTVSNGAVWTSDANGIGMGSYDIDSGFNSVAENVGRAVVVHEAGGDRAACGVLTGFNTLAVTEFSAYPGYSGSVPSGMFLVSEGVDALSMSYELSGLEASTSGGLHIHAGTSCATHDDVQGHYYNTTEDGWTGKNWDSDASGNGLGTLVVDSGYNYLSENQGHTVVIHNSGGDRIGCGILGPLHSLSATMGKYPAYPGSLTITGDVEAKVNTAGEITLQFALRGLETSASGGVHIHVGTSCGAHADVGGHYWNDSMADPWTSSNGADWTSDSYGNAVASISVDSGFNMLTDNLGHAVVVHEAGGDRAACGTLSSVATWLASSNLAPYPGYTGSQSFSGKVYVKGLSDGTLKMEWDLENMEPSMMGGIHIHAGTTCAASDVGGHFYDVTNVADFSLNSVDPWGISWGASMNGKSNGIAILDTGYNSLADNLGHAVVVHESGGTRAACALLSVMQPSDDNGAQPNTNSEPSTGSETISPGLYIFIFLMLSPSIPLIYFVSKKADTTIRAKTLHMKSLQAAADRLAKIEGGHIDLDADTQRGMYPDDEVSVRIEETATGHEGPSGETIRTGTPTPPGSPCRSASERREYPGGELSPRSMRKPASALASGPSVFPTGPVEVEESPEPVQAPSSPAPVPPEENLDVEPTISQKPPPGLPPTISEVTKVEVVPPPLPPRKDAKSEESKASEIGRQDTWTL